MARRTSRQNRQARREQLEQEKKRRNLIIGGVGGLIIVVLAGLIIFRIIASNIEGVSNFGSQSQGHDTNVVIENTELPPVGGVHDPAWQNCGIYNEPVETKNALHSMEHGAVWITYNPSLDSADVAQLEGLVRGESFLLLTPYPNLANDVVMTAWGVQLEVDSVDDERIEQFISVYRNGPQTPEPGAPCDGGVGVPVG